MKRLILVAFGVCALAAGGWSAYGAFLRSQGPKIIADARRALRAGRAAEAHQTLDRLLNFAPTDSEALLLKGLALKQAGDLKGAKEFLENVPESSKSSTTARFERALIALQEGSVDEAEVLLTQLTRDFPDLTEPADELRWLFFNTFRQRTLELFLEARLARKPGDVETLTHLLMTEFRSPVPREGMGYLQQVDRKHSGQSGVLRALAWCQWQLGETNEARQLIERALEQSPASPEVRLLALSFLVEQGELDSARTLLAEIEHADDTVIASLTRDDRWWWVQSNLEDQAGNTVAALNLVNEALEIRNFELKYVHRRGIILQKLHRVDEAARDFQRANTLESCATRLTEIVLSGALEHLNPETCVELSELSEKRGRTLQATGWRVIHDRRSGPERAHLATEVQLP